MKLQILHKGLLLIFVPLLLQMVFFAQLFNLVNQLEALEREQANHALMMAAADQIIMEFGTSWTTIICKLFGSPAYKLDAEAYKTRMEAMFARLQPIAAEYPEIRSLLAEAQNTSTDQYNLYKEMMAANAEPGIDPSLQLLGYAKLRSKFIRISNRGLVLKQLVEREIAGLTELRSKNERKRVSLKQQIFVGVAADFIVTALLLIAFLWDITKRLKVLVANAELIPTGSALAERVSGSDELALLDGVLHDASAELLQAKEHRKSIMEMLAHDLRSPLSSAKTTVDLLLNPTSSATADQSQAHLGRVRRSLTQLIAFVEDLLTIDRLESGKLELELSLFKISVVIDQCFDSLGIKAQARGIGLVKEGQDFEVVADQLRLVQVLMNLLGNAIKHSPDGGTVTVFTEAGEDAVRVAVLDQGKGIARAERERIFFKFVQSKDAKRQEGFGLGMAICKLIIDAHQGTIGLNSEVGKGSEFWFTLPADDD